MKLTISNAVKHAVATISIVLPLYPPLANSKLVVDILDDEVAIIDFAGDDLFIMVKLSTIKSFGDSSVVKESFIPGYYKHHAGGRWNPPEVEEMYFDSCPYILDAVGELIKFCFSHSAGELLSHDDLVQQMGFLDENAEQIDNAIRG